MAAIVCMAGAAINVAIAANDPTRYANWAAAVFCFGVGVVVAARP